MTPEEVGKLDSEAAIVVAQLYDDSGARFTSTACAAALTCLVNIIIFIFRRWMICSTVQLYRRVNLQI